MNIPANMIATLDAVLAPLEVGSPIELEDVLVVRRLVQDALPDFQVEAYHDGKRLIVGVGLSGIVIARRELTAVS